MKNKQITVVLTAFILSLSTVLSVFSLSVSCKRADEPYVSASSCILIEARTGKVIYEKNASEKRPMASTTKILTGLLAIESEDLESVVTVSKDAVGVEGSSIYLSANDRLTMEELVYALLLESANDAAAAIAIEVGGSVKGFAELMNKRAEEIGLSSSSFANPHGLDDEKHYTTASDLAKLTAVALENEAFRTVVSTYKKVFSDCNGNVRRILINHNRLLRSYDGMIGVKTGYTRKSGRCLVTSAERDGLRLICVTLNAPDDWNDHRKLLDYGFDRYRLSVDLKKGEFDYFAQVTGGEENLVAVTNKDDVYIVSEKCDGNISKTIELNKFYFAPVSESEVLGKLVFRQDGKVIAETDLVAVTDVRKTGKPSFFDRLKKILG